MPTHHRHHPRAPNVGKRTELARFNTPSGERVLYGQRIDGVVRVTDRPAGTGRRRPRIRDADPGAARPAGHGNTATAAAAA